MINKETDRYISFKYRIYLYNYIRKYEIKQNRKYN